MRRAPIVIAGTVAGLAAVLSFKPHEASLPTAVAATPSTGSAGGGSSSGSTGSSGSGGASGSSSSAAKSGSFTGDAVATRYGTAQVKVTMKDGRIADVEAVALPSDEPKSVAISTQAEPTLKQQALTKQSAAIDGVSGATITSAGYEASLQSALDRAGFQASDGSRGSSTIPDVEEHDGDRGGWGGDGDGGPPPGFAPPQG